MMTLIPPSKAEKIADDILSLDDKILSVSIRDWSRNSLALNLERLLDNDLE